MLNIAIVGDSWGEPNWRSPQPGFTAQGHVASQLAQRGHRVLNASVSGGSNLASWMRLRELERSQPHWIIWFHTDLARDWRAHDLAKPWQYQELIDRTALEVYSRINEIWLELAHCPMIIVEGQSVGHQPYFSEFFQHTEIIKDWRSELTGQELPQTQLLGPMSTSGHRLLANCRDSHSDQMKMIDAVETILRVMHQHDMFPDNCHPGDRAHSELLVKIEKIMAAKR